MRQLIEGCDGLRFVGTIEVQDDLDAAAYLAQSCRTYRIDEDDEDYLDGARSCFNCRYRRWRGDGFSCAKSLLAGIPGRR